MRRLGGRIECGVLAALALIAAGCGSKDQDPPLAPVPGGEPFGAGAECQAACPGPEGVTCTGLAPAPELLTVITGDEAGEARGVSLAPADDVDGDGRPEILVGSGFGTDAEPGAGRLRLIGASGAILKEWPGNVAGARLGRGVAFVRDAFAAAAPAVALTTRPTAADGGLGTGEQVVLSTLDGQSKAVWQSAKYPNAVGLTLASPGDLNQDGRGDLVVGLPGAASLKGALVAIRLDDAGAPVVLWERPGQTGWRLGYAIAGIADVTGDGIPDVVAGRPFASYGRGVVDVYSGADGSLHHTLANPSGQKSRCGESVAPAGDLDGDGLAELAVGCPLETSGGLSRRGVVRIFSGAGLQAKAAVQVLSGIVGSWAAGELGTTVAAAGDVDGDGIPDVAAGAPSAAPGGAAVVVSGASGALLLQHAGSVAGARVGVALAGGSDWNGDGLSDVVVGAEDTGTALAGSVTAPHLTSALDLEECIAAGGQGVSWCRCGYRQPSVELGTSAECAADSLACCRGVGDSVVLAASCDPDAFGEPTASPIELCLPAQVCCERPDPSPAQDPPADEAPAGRHSLRVLFSAAGCASRTLCNGHGTCASATTCACEAGWAGPCCTVPFDCASAPCLNGGTCAENACVCPTGFEGVLCETNVDDCRKSATVGPGELGAKNGVVSAAVQILDEPMPPGACIQAVDVRFPDPPPTDTTGWELRIYERLGERVVLRDRVPVPFNAQKTTRQSVALETCLPVAALARVALAQVHGKLGTRGGETSDPSKGSLQRYWLLPTLDSIVNGPPVDAGPRLKGTLGWSVTLQRSPCADDATCVDGVESYQCICAPGTSGQTCDKVCPGGLVPKCRSETGSAATLTQGVGAAEGDGHSAAVAVIPDQDGDGVADLLIGAPGSDGNSAIAEALAKSPIACKTMSAPCPAEVNGIPAVLGCAPTEDGEGAGADPSAPVDLLGTCELALDEAGAATILSGKTGQTLRVLTGGSPGERFGATVARLGDVDGDGVAEFAVGAPSALWAGEAAGKVSVYSGKSGILVRELTGDEPLAAFGAAIADAGDVDGDGRADVAVGAPRAGDEAGRVTVFSSAGWSVAWRFDGALAGAAAGSALAAAGDLDCDGRGDLAVGQPGYSDGHGRVTFLSGATGLRLGVAVDGVGCGFDPAPADVDGAELGSRFGAALAALPDVDGDGTPDLACGAPGAGTGSVALVSGATRGVVGTLAGPEVGDGFGVALASIGDYDGDGLADLAIGATQPGLASAGAGYVTVVTASTRAAIASIPGDRAGGGFGSALAAAGDLNGDGLGDLLTGAPTEEGRGLHRALFSADGCRAATVCNGHGTCADGAAGAGTCACDKGFSGAACDVDADECAAMTCPAHSTCVDGAGAATCECDPGWYGTGCASSCPTDAPVVCQVGIGDAGGDLALRWEASGAGAPAVTIVGDVDGDGLAEVARADASVSAVTLLSGVDGAVLATLAPPAADGAPDPAFGTRMAALGRFDGDLVPDLAVASGTASRRVTVYSGDGARQIASFSSGSSTYGDALLGGDVTGDGRAELLIGDPGAEAGAVWIHADAGLGAMATLTGPALFGTDLVRVGDLTADGVADLAVLAPSAGAGQPSTVHLFAFPAAAPIAVISVDGAVVGVADAGDVDQDGVSDLAIGTPAGITIRSGKTPEEPALLSVPLAAPMLQLVSLGDWAGDHVTTLLVRAESQLLRIRGAEVSAVAGLPAGVVDLAVGADVTGDGRGDLALGMANGQVQVRFNAARCQAERTCGPGTCLDGVTGDGACLCPPGYTGSDCLTNVDACALAVNACAATQGRGTCVDQDQGFACDCKAGFYASGCGQVCPTPADAAPCTWSFDHSASFPGTCPRSNQLVAARDLNQDGADDLILGGMWDATTGRPFVKATSLVAPMNMRWEYPGPEALAATSCFGAQVGELPDVDGDGLSDWYATSAGTKELFIYSGAMGLPLLTISHDSLLDSAVIVASPGEVDGDGRADLAVATKPSVTKTVFGTLTIYSTKPLGELLVFSGASGDPRGSYHTTDDREFVASHPKGGLLMGTSGALTWLSPAGGSLASWSLKASGAVGLSEGLIATADSNCAAVVGSKGILVPSLKASVNMLENDQIINLDLGPTVPCVALGTADTNGDGNVELVIASDSTVRVHPLPYSKNDTFIDAVHGLDGVDYYYTSYFPNSIISGDFDGDGRDAVIVTATDKRRSVMFTDGGCAARQVCGRGECDDGALGQGACACAPGFGPGPDGQCTVNIDDCTQDACQNGGLCIDQVLGTACRCPTGWDGEQCEINEDDCTIRDRLGLWVHAAASYESTFPYDTLISGGAVTSAGCVERVSIAVPSDTVSSPPHVDVYEFVGHGAEGTYTHPDGSSLSGHEPELFALVRTGVAATLTATEPLSADVALRTYTLKTCLPVSAGDYLGLHGVTLPIVTWSSAEHVPLRVRQGGPGLPGDEVPFFPRESSASASVKSEPLGLSFDVQASPCVNGACVDEVAGFTCQCPEGFYGEDCSGYCHTARPQKCFVLDQMVVSVKQEQPSKMAELFKLNFGRGAANLGDVDGDGVDDFAVGGYAVDSATTSYNLTTTDAQPSLLLGWSSCKFEMTGISLNTAKYICSRKGRVDAYSGKPPHAVIWSRERDPALFGFSLAALGDVDGDGVRDLVVGQPNDEGGKAFVLSGKAGTILYTLTNNKASNTNIDQDSETMYGYSVANIGDYDGDGVDDFAVGSPDCGAFDGASVQLPGFEDGPDVFDKLPACTNVDEPKAHIFVYSGASPTKVLRFAFTKSWYAATQDAPFGPDGVYKIGEGDNVWDPLLGAAIVPLGDVLPGGFDEFAVAAGTPSQPSIRIFSAAYTNSHERAPLTITDLPSGQIVDGRWTIYAPSFAGADVNGDGSKDLAWISAYDCKGDHQGPCYSRLRIALSPRYRPLWANWDPDQWTEANGGPPVEITGLGTSKGRPTQVHAAGDVNGDGFDDLVVVSLEEPPGATVSSSGQMIRLLSGRDIILHRSESPIPVESVQIKSYALADSNTTGHWAGFVGGIDPDGDGLPDPIVILPTTPTGSQLRRLTLTGCGELACAGAGQCVEGMGPDGQSTWGCACDAGTLPEACTNGAVAGDAIAWGAAVDPAGAAPTADAKPVTLPTYCVPDATGANECRTIVGQVPTGAGDDYAIDQRSLTRTSADPTKGAETSAILCPGAGLGEWGAGYIDQVWTFTPKLSGTYTFAMVRGVGYAKDYKASIQVLEQGDAELPSRCLGLKDDETSHIQDLASTGERDGVVDIGVYLRGGRTYVAVIDGLMASEKAALPYYQFVIREGGCIPSCGDGAVCGPDGCGGFCGLCADADEAASKVSLEQAPACLNAVRQCYVPRDTCEHATPLALGVPASGDTAAKYEKKHVAEFSDAYHFEPGDCRGQMDVGLGAGAKDQAFVFQPPETGIYEVRVSGVSTDFDPVVYVAKDECALLSSDACIGAANTCKSGKGELLVDWMAEDVSYYVIVDGAAAGMQGSFDVTVSLVASLADLESQTAQATYDQVVADYQAYAEGMACEE